MGKEIFCFYKFTTSKEFNFVPLFMKVWGALQISCQIQAHYLTINEWSLAHKKLCHLCTPESKGVQSPRTIFDG